MVARRPAFFAGHSGARQSRSPCYRRSVMTNISINLLLVKFRQQYCSLRAFSPKAGAVQLSLFPTCFEPPDTWFERAARTDGGCRRAFSARWAFITRSVLAEKHRLGRCDHGIAWRRHRPFRWRLFQPSCCSLMSGAGSISSSWGWPHLAGVRDCAETAAGDSA